MSRRTDWPGVVRDPNPAELGTLGSHAGRVRFHLSTAPMRHRHLHGGPDRGRPRGRSRHPVPGRRDRRTQLGARLRQRGPLADQAGQRASLPRRGAGDRPVQRRRRLRPTRVRPLRPVEGRRLRRRPLDRGHVRGPPHAVPRGAEEAGARQHAHRAAGALARDPRGRPVDRRDRARARRDGRDRGRHPGSRLRHQGAPARDPARDAPHRAEGAPPPEGEARPRRAHDRLDVRPRRAGQGPRVRDRGDARGRGPAPRGALPDRGPDPPRAAQAARRGIPQPPAGACRRAGSRATTCSS